MKANATKAQAYWIVKTQAVVLLAESLLGLVCLPGLRGWSIVFGGLIAFVPTLVLYKLMFKHVGARAAKKTVQGFYLGEFLKFVLTIIGFSAVFCWPNVWAAGVWLGFLTIQSMFWLALWPKKR